LIDGFSCNDIRQRNVTNKTVGIDVGLKNWIMLDSGEMIDRPRFQDTAIESLQRAVSRKKKDSKNRRKAVILLLEKAWRKVGLQREDYCQKVTTDLAKRFQTLVFEKLKISSMVKSSLAHQIYDASWYKLRQLADYKSEVVFVDTLHNNALNVVKFQNTRSVSI
jgi:putative transposase